MIVDFHFKSKYLPIILALLTPIFVIALNLYALGMVEYYGTKIPSWLNYIFIILYFVIPAIGTFTSLKLLRRDNILGFVSLILNAIMILAIIFLIVLA